ncbi:MULTISPECIES: SMI1/KNR4 family protein [unclassified Exiguobacterium]|uniref:SMI1/KNR4 family protein n=1 Tax=unclassified Exiguobacterium TaxID=2644629 RepID=UPI001BEC1EF4|nr:MULTISPECIES: SMI1/KNR4 family protein [unclassified Exiguobacterium]
MKFWDELLEEEVAPSLNQKEVKKIEKKLGASLPKKYIEKLEEQNGGELTFDSVNVDFENTWSDEKEDLHLPLYRFNPLTVDDFKDGMSTLNEWGLTGKMLMFGEGEGSYFWYFDFDTNPNEPQIWCLDISDETTHLVAESFDQLLDHLVRRNDQVEGGVELTHEDVFADYPSMDEIREVIAGNDEDERLMAYRMWSTRGEDVKGLVSELRGRVQDSNDEDELDSYAELLAQVLMDRSVENYMTHEQAIALFNEKEDVSDLSHVVVQLESDM